MAIHQGDGPTPAGLMERRPDGIQVVVVDRQVSAACILVGMEDDLEAVAMQAIPHPAGKVCSPPQQGQGANPDSSAVRTLAVKRCPCRRRAG